MAVSLLRSFMRKVNDKISLTFVYKCSCTYTADKKINSDTEEVSSRETVIIVQESRCILFYICVYDKWATKVICTWPYFVLNPLHILDTLNDNNLPSNVILKCDNLCDKHWFYFDIKCYLGYLRNRGIQYSITPGG